MRESLASFGYGLTLPVRAAGMILRHPILLFWSVLPVLLTVGLYYFGVRTAEAALQAALAHRMVAWGFAAGSWVTAILLFFTKLLVLILAALSFSFVASLLSTPFNDFLAESAERWVLPRLPHPSVPARGIFAGYWRNKARLILIDAMKTLIAGALGVVVLVCAWIPAVNLAALMMGFLLVSFQYVSYPQTRRGEGVLAGARFLGRHVFLCLGFGIAVSTLFSIPFVSFLALPLAVVGGTLLDARARGGALA